MNLKNVGQVIAIRELTSNSGKKITVTIGIPEMFPDGGDDYYCPYQIIGIGNERVRYAGGIDSVQSLELAFKMIGTDLYTSAEAQAGELNWAGGSKKGDLGFPVPDVMSDLLPD